jgi:hypothetical protein
VTPPLRFGILFGLILLAIEGFVVRGAFRYLARHGAFSYLWLWWKVGVAVLAAALVFFVLCLLARLGLRFLDDFLMPIPVAGSIYRRLFRPVTYYELDTAAMYRTAVHAAVTEALGGLTTTRGMRRLTEEERRPSVRDFLGA